MTPSELAGLATAQMWQLTMLIVVIAAIVLIVGRKRPHLAHVLWLVVLAKCLTPPVISSAGSVFSRLQPARWTSPSDWAELDDSLPSRGTLPTGLTALVTADRNLQESDGPAGTDPIRVVSPGTANEHGKESVAVTGARRITSRWDVVLRRVGAIWMAGSLLLVAIALFRWGMCLREIRSAPVIARPDLDRLVADLAKRLRVGRSVRLLVTDSRIGPAVIGLFRPLILLPLAIVEGKSACDLEAVVAHELIHVRRGDLWIGLVQVVAQCVWWFHPLVWLVNRRTTRAAEACCDEEVVAELRCDPAAYAGSLLEVLELKRRLVSVPAFPGMRPVDVTRERLERIMQFGQGCRRATPWWCWIVLVLAAIATLPGAALVVSAEEEKQNERRQAVDPHRATNVDNSKTGSNGSLGVQIPDRSCRFQIGKFCFADGDTGKIRDQATVLETFSPASEQLPTKLFSIVADHIESEGAVLSVRAPYLRCRDHVQMSFESVEVTADVAVVTMLKSRTALGPNDDKEVLSIRLTGNVRWSCGEWKAGAEDVQFVWREQGEGDSATLLLADVTLEGSFQMETSGTQVRADHGVARYGTDTKDSAVNLTVPRLPDSVAVAGNVVIRRRNADRQPYVLRTDDAEVFLRSDSIQVGKSDREAVAVPKADPSATTLVGTGVNSSAGLAGTVVLADAAKSAKEKQPSSDSSNVVKPELSVVTYSVADLIIPYSKVNLTVWPTDDEKRATASDGHDDTKRNGYRVHMLLPETSVRTRDDRNANFGPLIELIQATTGHDRWSEFGGEGSITQFATTLSLVVRQTRQVHDEIGTLLSQLRKLHGLQTVLHVEIFYFPGVSKDVPTLESHLTEAAKRGLDPSDEQIAALRKIVAAGQGQWLTEDVKFTLHNGQGAELVLRRLWRAARPPLLLINPAIFPDRSAVRLHLAVGAANAVDALAHSRTFIVKDRRPLLLDVTDDVRTGRLGLPIVEPLTPGKLLQKTLPPERTRGNEQVLLLITPKIVVHEEEEALNIKQP